MAVLAVAVAAWYLMCSAQPVQEEPVDFDTALIALHKAVYGRCKVIAKHLKRNIRDCKTEMVDYTDDTKTLFTHLNKPKMKQHLSEDSVKMVEKEVNERQDFKQDMESREILLKKMLNSNNIVKWGKKEVFEWRKMLLSKGLCHDMNEPFCTTLMAVDEKYEHDLAVKTGKIPPLKEKVKEHIDYDFLKFLDLELSGGGIDDAQPPNTKRDASVSFIFGAMMTFLFAFIIAVSGFLFVGCAVGGFLLELSEDRDED